MRLWKDQPWNGEMLSQRCHQVWCLCCRCSSQVNAYGQEEKGAPMSTAFVSCGVCDGYGQNRKALREMKSSRFSLCKSVGRTGLSSTWSCLFSTACDVRGRKGQKDHRKHYHGTSDIEKAAIFTAQHETKRGSSVVFVLDLGKCKMHYVLNLFNLINSADGGCRRTMSPGGACWCWDLSNRNCGSQPEANYHPWRVRGTNPSRSKRLQRARQRSKGLLEALSLAGRM